MLVHTRKPHIRYDQKNYTFEIQFNEPLSSQEKDRLYSRIEEAIDVNDYDSILWEECDIYKESVGKYGQFGAVLRGMRYREELTQVQLSGKTGIPQRHISEMERGKRTIGKKNAKILADALNCSYKVFL